MSRVWVGIGVLICVSVSPVSRAALYVRGKVVMVDGSPPDKSVEILRNCGGHSIHEASTDRKGGFLIPDPLYDSIRAGTITSELGSAACFFQASLPGYNSTKIDLSERTAAYDPILPALVLTPRNQADTTAIVEEANAPRAAQQAWIRAMKASKAKNWHEAETQLRAAVEAAPRFAQGWTTLGMVCQNQQKTKEAQEAYRRAIELDPKLLSAYLLLARMEVGIRAWEDAAKTADALVKTDRKGRYPEGYLDQAIVRYHLHNIDGAEASVREAIRLDTKRQLPRAEYVLGLIYEAKKNYTSAGEHMRKYLELEPKASDSTTVQARLDHLGRREATDVAAALDAVDAKLPDAKEAWVPGGMKALAAALHLREVPSHRKFFAEYCGALVRHGSRVDDEASAYIPSIQAYFAAVGELVREGDLHGATMSVTLSLATDSQNKRASGILRSLGWRVVQTEGSARVEPGDQPVDGLRQQITTVFGIDEIGMQEALEAGRSFQFEIPLENARLIGGDAGARCLPVRPLCLEASRKHLPGICVWPESTPV